MPLRPLRWWLCAMAGATLAAGCAGASLVTAYSPLNRAPAPLGAKAAADVELMTIAPSRPFVEVGTVSVRRSPGLSGMGRPCVEIVSLLRQEAARRGCDGLLVDRSLVACASSGGRDEPANYSGGILGSCLAYVKQ